MRLVIVPDYAELCRWAASYIQREIERFAPDAQRPFVLGLPTGSTPVGVYDELARRTAEEKLSFEHVVTFNMDEYLGLPAEHPQSYHSFMQQHWLSRVDMRPENFHILDGMAADPQSECDRYEEKIRRFGGVQLFLGGLGHDGHIAFNEPGSSLSSRTRIKTLTDDTRRANARFFGGDVRQVPRQALTVGVGTIMDARQVMLLVSGGAKAEALKQVVEGAVSHQWTASALQLHPQAIVVCDEEATLELRVRTVRYYKEIERNIAADGGLLP